MLLRNAKRAKAIAVIINPSSAGGKSLTVWPQYRLKFEAQDFAVTEHTSVSEADFRETVKHFARKFKLLAVCGGDSSLTIAAEELLAAGFRGELIFLPGGSVNDILLDIRGQKAAAKKTIYLGEISSPEDTKQFIGQANWGLGVVVNRWVGYTLRVFPFLRPLQNFIGVLSIVMAHGLRRELVDGEIVADIVSESGCWSIVIVSQIKYWASGLQFCPDASFHRPEFEILTVKRCGLIRLIKIILAAKHGRHTEFPEVARRLARSVELRAEKPEAVQIDGDILRSATGEVKARRYTLKKTKTLFRLSTLTVS